MTVIVNQGECPCKNNAAEYKQQNCDKRNTINPVFHFSSPFLIGFVYGYDPMKQLNQILPNIPLTKFNIKTNGYPIMYSSRASCIAMILNVFALWDGQAIFWRVKLVNY